MERAIRQGLEFLAENQRPDGSFWCLTSTRFDDYASRAAEIEEVPAIVPTNIVLSSLTHIKSARAEYMKQKAADFLLSEKSNHWAFNYWYRKTERYKIEPYPDDLDDTFCALAALYEYRPQLFDGEAMAKIVTMLASAEKKEGGPYDMWLVPPEGRATWNDTDLVVNSNIAYFLSLQGITLPNVTKFIEASIDAQDYEFPYNTIYPGIYFISRSYRGPKMKQMADLLLAKREVSGKWENPLRTALAVSSLLNFHDHGMDGSGEWAGDLSLSKILDEAVAYLLREQADDGSWPPAAFFFQMRKKERTLYAGSASTTTALCLEALGKVERYKKAGRSREGAAQPPLKREDKTGEDRIYDETVQAVRRRFSECRGDLRKFSQTIIEKTLRGDPDRQIAMLPFFFRKSLGRRGSSISDEMIVRLGAANIFGWMAYTIYDDFLDGDGDPVVLPLANICLRELTTIFNDFEEPFRGFARRVLDTIDGANTWEALHCRLPASAIPDFGDHSQLAEKSFGHALGPAAILFALGCREDSQEMRQTMAFFKNYLIARQLNDDAHDWAEDLTRGYINAAAARLLRQEGGRWDAKSPGMEILRGIFWREMVTGICGEILAYADKAKNALKAVPIMENTAYLGALLAPIERSVDRALKEREETLRFLQTYRG